MALSLLPIGRLDGGPGNSSRRKSVVGVTFSGQEGSLLWLVVLANHPSKR